MPYGPGKASHGQERPSSSWDGPLSRPYAWSRTSRTCSRTITSSWPSARSSSRSAYEPVVWVSSRWISRRSPAPVRLMTTLSFLYITFSLLSLVYMVGPFMHCVFSRLRATFIGFKLEGWSLCLCFCFPLSASILEVICANESVASWYIWVVKLSSSSCQCLIASSMRGISVFSEEWTSLRLNSPAGTTSSSLAPRLIYPL